MKQFTHYLFPLLFGSVFMALNSLPARSAEMDKNILATVNGTNITQEMFETYSKRRGMTDLSKIKPEEKKTITEELVNRELLYQIALKNKLDKDPEVTREIDNIQRNLYASAAIRKAVSKQDPITEEMMKSEYKKVIKDLPAKEYKARHILTSAKQDAIAVILELNKGVDFAKLAKEKSTGPTGANGGDLGWFRDGQMLPEFTAAVTKLKKGEYSKAPVKTQYGWHVILLEDERKAPAPAYEDLKKQINMSLRNKQLGDYVESLKKKAKIEIR
jgi:peptidyl-prolyl cis-trans isomerase C